MKEVTCEEYTEFVGKFPYSCCEYVLVDDVTTITYNKDLIAKAIYGDGKVKCTPKYYIDKEFGLNKFKKTNNV